MMSELSKHESVLLEEVARFLAVKTGGNYLDCTFGGGGHSRAILAVPGTTVTALDRDPAVTLWATALAEQFPNRFHFEPWSYQELDQLTEQFDGILFDLGLSSD